MLDLVARSCIASEKSTLIMSTPMMISMSDETKVQFIIIMILLRLELTCHEYHTSEVPCTEVII